MFFQLGAPENRRTQKKSREKKKKEQAASKSGTPRGNSEKKNVRILSGSHDRSTPLQSKVSRPLDRGFNTINPTMQVERINPDSLMLPMDSSQTHGNDTSLLRSTSELKRDQLFGLSRAQPERRRYMRRRKRWPAILPKDPADMELHSFSSFEESEGENSGESAADLSVVSDEFRGEIEGELALVFNRQRRGPQRVTKLVGQEHFSEIVSGTSGKLHTVLAESDGAAGASFNIITNVKVCYGIATAYLKFPIPIHQIGAWLALLITCLYTARRLVFASVIDEVFNLGPALSTLEIHFRSCNVRVVSTNDISRVELRTWKFLFTNLPVFDASTEWRNSLTVSANNLSTFWQCSINVYLSPDELLNHLALSEEASKEPPTLIIEDVPKGATEKLSITVHQCDVHMKNVTTTSLAVNIYDGGLIVSDWHGQDAKVSSSIAPVYFESSTQSIFAQIDKQVAPYCVVRSDSQLSGHHSDDALLFRLDLNQTDLFSSSSMQPLFLHYSSPSTAPLYLTLSGQRKTNATAASNFRFKGWVGTEQLKPPRLTDASVHRIENLQRWSNPRQPWIYLIKPTSDRDLGRWELVSSSALLSSQNVHTLMTLGILKAEVSVIAVHTIGNSCSKARAQTDEFAIWFDVGANQSMKKRNLVNKGYEALAEGTNWSDWFAKELEALKNETRPHLELGEWQYHLEDSATCLQFLTIAEYLSLHKELVRSFPAQMLYSDYVLWRPSSSGLANGMPVTKFETSSGSIKISTITWRDSLPFTLSFAISVTISFLILINMMNWLYRGLTTVLYSGMARDESFEKAQSYRLNFDTSATLGITQHTWLINAYVVHRPNPGFVLYWSFNRVHVNFHQMIIVCCMERPQRDLLEDLADALVEEPGMSETSSTSVLDRENAESSEDVYIYITNSAITVTESMKSVEFPARFPSRVRPTMYGIDTKQRWELNPDALYRFKLMAVDSAGRKIDESAWSCQMAVPRSLGPDDMEPHLLKRLLPCEMSSWHVFWRKCVMPQRTYQFPIIFNRVNLRLTEPLTHPANLQLNIYWANAADQAVSSVRFSVTDLSTSIVNISEAASGSSPLRLTYKSMDQRYITLAVYDRGTHVQVAQGRVALFDDHMRGVPLITCGAGLVWGIVTFYVDPRPFRHYINDFHPGSFKSMTATRRSSSESEGPRHLRLNRELAKAKSGKGRRPLKEGFQNVHPGMIICEGRDFELVWTASSIVWDRFNIYVCFLTPTFTQHDWEKEELGHIDTQKSRSDSLRRVSLSADTVEHMGLDEYARICVFERRFKCASVKRVAQNVTNLGRYHWTPEMEGESIGIVKLVFTLSSNFTPATDEKYYQSNSFVIARPVLLSELEYAYAAFCRIHNMPTVSILQEEPGGNKDMEVLPNGVKIVRTDLRVCSGLRRPLAFERVSKSYKLNSNPYIITPGQQIITGSTKLVLQSDSPDMGAANKARYEVFKAEARAAVPVVCDVEIEQDPFWWTCSNDGFCLSVDCLPGLWLLDRTLDLWSASWFRMTCFRFIFPKGIVPAMSPQMRRFILFQFWPCAWESVLQMVGAIIFFCSAFQWAGLFFVYNVLRTETKPKPHMYTNSAYLSDAVYMTSASYHRNFAFTVPAVIFVTLSFQMTFRLMFKYLLNHPRWRKFALVATTVHLLNAGILICLLHLILPFALCWFIVAVLLDPNTWLPPAILIAGAVGLVVYEYLKYTGARAYIKEKVAQQSDMIQNLMFAAYFMKRGAFDDEHNQLAEGEIEDRSNVELALQTVRRYGASLIGGDRAHDSDVANRKRDWGPFVLWKFSKSVPSTEQGYWYDDLGSPQGLHTEPSLPFGARFATLSEYDRHKELFQSMLIGSEIVMLQEGILTGPRYGYRTESPPIPDASYTSAIVAIPWFPQPMLMSTEMKVEIIFQVFDRDKDRRLNEVEFFLWARCLNKAILIRGSEDEMLANEWNVVVHYVNSQYRLNGNTKDGFGYQDLLAFYITAGEASLNRDYVKMVTVDEKLVPPIDSVEANEPTDGDSLSAALGVDELVIKASREKRDEMPEEWSDTKLVWTEIYETITGGETKMRLEEVTNDGSVARNIYLTQLALLVPTIGLTTLLRNQNAGSTGLDMVGYTPPEEQFQWTRLICLAYEDTFVRITQVIVNEHNSLFSNVLTKIDSWIDYSLRDEINRKVEDITSCTMGMDMKMLSKLNCQLLQYQPCKTNFVAYRTCIFSFGDPTFLESKSAAILLSPTTAYEFRWTHLTQLLLNCGYVKPDTIEWHDLPNPFLPGATLSFPLFRLPAYYELFDSIYVEEQSRIFTLQGDDFITLLRNYVLKTDYMLRYVCKTYLSLSNIMFLLSMMGMDLCQQRLPAGAVRPVLFSAQEEGCQCRGSMCSCEWSYIHIYQGVSVTNEKPVERVPVSVFEVLSPDVLELMGLPPTCAASENVDHSGPPPQIAFEDQGNRLLNQQSSGAQVGGHGRSHAIFSDNLQVIRHHLYIMSHGIMLLKADLADEFIKQITCNELHLNGVKSLLRSMRLSEDIEQYDWSKFGVSSAWDLNLSKIFTYVSRGHDFISRTDIPQLVRSLRKYLEGSGSATGRSSYTNIRITADIFHSVLLTLGITRDRRDSSTFWLLVSTELGYVHPASTLTGLQVATTMARILFQPIAASGAKFTGSALADIHAFVGGLPYFALEFILRAIGIDMSPQHRLNVWQLMPKQPIDLTWCEAVRTSAQLRTRGIVTEDLSSDDDDAAHPNRVHYTQEQFELLFQDFVHFDVLKTFLARVLLTGLPPEGIPVLVRLCCGLNQGADRVQDVIERHKDKLTKFGVFSPATVCQLICLLHVEGLNLNTWLTLIKDSMAINVPLGELRQVFNIIDVNQNRFLECEEVMVGIGRLLDDVLVKQLIELLDYTPRQQVLRCALLAMWMGVLIVFLCSVIPTFSSGTSSLADTVQNMLALAGAVAFRSGSMRRDPGLEERIKASYPLLFGDDYKERLLKIADQKRA